MKTLFKILSAIISFLRAMLYPEVCISCGDIVDEGESLCNYCRENIERINPEKRCMKCGFEKKNCVCSVRVYSFQSVISLFENTDIAQRAYYKYKLFHRKHYSDYFAKALAIAIKSEFYDVDFDGICYVPSSKRSILSRGFDHSKRLAEQVSRLTGIAFMDELLICKEFVRPQHKSNFEERLKNVKGKYSFSRNVNCKNILLFDDIRTSGATLDECSLQLLKAGADKVYCITVLAQVHKKDKVEKK